jgi:hypothetical protein
MAIDENHDLDNQPINLYKHPREGYHKVHDKLSGSLSDSGYILANIQNKHSTNKSKKKSGQVNGKLMKDYMTYNAVNFDYKKDRKSSKSREKSGISSRSVPKGSASITESDQNPKSSQIQKNKSYNKLSKPAYDNITVTSVVPSTINSVMNERNDIGTKYSSNTNKSVSARSYAEKIRSRQAKTSSEERDHDMKFSTDMRSLFYPTDRGRMNEVDRPITSLDQYITKVTITSKNDSPVRNRATNKAASAQKLNK